MRAKALLLVVAIAALSIQGCSLVIGASRIGATDLSTVVVGADRAQVESVLGTPETSEEIPPGEIATYSYDRGASGNYDLNVYRGAKLYGIILEPLLTPLALIMRDQRIKDQRGGLTITYAADDTVVRVETAEQRREEMRRREAEELLAKAQCGDAQAQYDLGQQYRNGWGVAEDCSSAAPMVTTEEVIESQ